MPADLLAPPADPPPRAPRPGVTAGNATAAPGADLDDRDFDVPDGTPCTEHDYLHRYNGQAGIEYVDGRICYLPMPSRRHQRSAAFVYDLLKDELRDRGFDAEVNFAGLRVRTTGRFRDPDVTALLDRDDPRAHDTHFDYADLCAEVVSPDDPPRDTVEKRREYAAAGIPEYWIVDPREEVRTVTVLTLVDGVYQGEPRGDGEVAESVLLPGLSFDVTACPDAR